MRSGTVVAIIVALVIVIGAVLWLGGQDEQSELEVEGTENAALPAPADEADPLAAEGTAGQSGGATDEPIVVGDEITPGTIVVDSATEEPVILDPDQVDTSVEIVDEADPLQTTAPIEGSISAEPAADASGDQPVPAGSTAGGQTEDEPGVSPASETPESATAVGEREIEPADLLTPENYDRDRVVALIDESGQLTEERRSSLRALIDGAAANPSLVDPAITAIRAALNLPPLN